MDFASGLRSESFTVCLGFTRTTQSALILPRKCSAQTPSWVEEIRIPREWLSYTSRMKQKEGSLLRIVALMEPLLSSMWACSFSPLTSRPRPYRASVLSFPLPAVCFLSLKAGVAHTQRCPKQAKRCFSRSTSLSSQACRFQGQC